MISHTIPCPQCGYEVPTRAALGQGTTRGKSMQLNANRKAILHILQESMKPLSVSDVHKKLVYYRIRRISKKGTDWNYHTVQADMSLLLGAGLIEMYSNKPETWDNMEGFQTNGIPTYRIVRLEALP